MSSQAMSTIVTGSSASRHDYASTQESYLFLSSKQWAHQGLYYLGSLLAHQVLWLGIADKSAVDAVVRRKESLQSAFFALQ